MNKKENIETNNSPVEEQEGISRREAIKKIGYAAFATSTMFLLLNNPTKVYAQSPGGDPGDDWEW